MGTKGQISIRRAQPDDVDWLVGQLQLFSKFFGTKKNLFSDEAFARNSMIVMMRDHLVFIADRNHEPVGFISGYTTPHPFNPDIKVLSEQFWWVDEAHRGSRAGLMLLKEFMKWGKQYCDWITFGLEQDSPVNDRVLLAHGFRLKERSFLMEVT